LHQWNVRRLRPAELTPIDYEQPVIVPSLWFAEGVTSYVDQLLPLAAGIGAETDLLDDLGADLSRYLLTPGRRVQSLRLSSQEAWVKLYRPDAYAADSQISYYLKGAVLALVLDLHLRRHGAALCRVLQELWRSHGRWGRGYREEDLIGAFADHAVDLSTLLPKWLASTEDPPLEDYLEDVGLRLVSECSSQPFMGWQFESNSQAGLKLKRVYRDGPAEQAGLQVGDELLALDHQRLRLVEDLGPLLSADRASSSLELLFCRDGRVRTAVVMPAAPAIERWRLQIDPAAAPGVAQRRACWLSLQP
jgi:predicted metalloprotease with PDZ domain